MKIAGEPQMVRLSQLADRGDDPIQEGDFYPATPSPENAMILTIDLAKTLSSAEHQMLMLELEGLTHREIGVRLGIGEAAVRSRLFRLRDKLRRAGVNSYAARPSGGRHEL
jgi:DNA-directed RNA polymerase specialized sigma24 family protein